MSETMKARLQQWLINAINNKNAAPDEASRHYYQGCVDTLTDTLNLF